MKILAFGDVVGQAALSAFTSTVRKQRDALGADMVVVNGENATEVRGICARDAHLLADAGVDLITLGNHTYGMHDLYTLLEDESFPMIRPANFPAACPGSGYRILRIDGYRVLCINIQGVVYMEQLASPFETVDRILAREAGAYDLALMDIHAEVTSEKLAIARYFDGRISVMFGTHTHVQTADEQILPGGSGYITDLGMTGPTGGIIGTSTKASLDRFLTHMPTHFTVAEGEIAVHGALFDVDPETGRVRSVHRIAY